jgi:hypothetical protein
VIQNGTGIVVGVILAWCQRNHIAYIQPLQVVLEDIKRTLGVKEVCLPRFKRSSDVSPNRKSFDERRSMDRPQTHPSAFPSDDHTMPEIDCGVSDNEFEVRQPYSRAQGPGEGL